MLLDTGEEHEWQILAGGTLHVFYTEEAARNYLANVRIEMPLGTEKCSEWTMSMRKVVRHRHVLPQHSTWVWKQTENCGVWKTEGKAKPTK